MKNWFSKVFHRPPPHPAQASNNPWEQRRLERAAALEDRRAQNVIRHGQPELKVTVAGFNGIVEVTPRPPLAISDDGKCPKCQYLGSTRLPNGERRCAACGVQFWGR
jgi:hypothetical protein